jgi:uncharacterized protein DUF642/PEP-CTERM motif-containing protein
MKASRLLGAAMLMAPVCWTGAAHANLLTNGSFEDTTNFVNQGNDTDSLAVGSTAMTGWTVIGGEPLAWIGPTNPFGLTASPGGGSYFLDLTDYRAGAPFSGVSQTIATSPGATYSLTFELGSSPQYGVQDGVLASAGSASQSFATTNNGSQNNLWQPETFSFRATGSTTDISLVGNLGANYIGLDNVSVVETAVPEPAAWLMLLAGVGGVGAALRSCQKPAVAAA